MCRVFEAEARGDQNRSLRLIVCVHRALVRGLLPGTMRIFVGGKDEAVEAMNLRPLSPQKRLQAIHTMAAVERQRVHQAQQKKAVLDEEMRQRAEIHANRREVKKAREAAERRAAALAVRQRQLLTSVAVAARVKHLAKVVTTYREISGEEKEQTDRI